MNNHRMLGREIGKFFFGSYLRGTRSQIAVIISFNQRIVSFPVFLYSYNNSNFKFSFFSFKKDSIVFMKIGPLPNFDMCKSLGWN